MYTECLWMCIYTYENMYVMDEIQEGMGEWWFYHLLLIISIVLKFVFWGLGQKTYYHHNISAFDPKTPTRHHCLVGYLLDMWLNIQWQVMDDWPEGFGGRISTLSFCPISSVLLVCLHFCLFISLFNSCVVFVFKNVVFVEDSVLILNFI